MGAQHFSILHHTLTPLTCVRVDVFSGYHLGIANWELRWDTWPAWNQSESRPGGFYGRHCDDQTLVDDGSVKSRIDVSGTLLREVAEETGW